MNGKELINILNEKGAIKNFYKVTYSPNVMIDGNWYDTRTLLITIDDFIKNFINNLDIENELYVYDIMDNPISHPGCDDPEKYIRYFEHDSVCEYKIRIKKLRKIKEIINAT